MLHCFMCSYISTQLLVRCSLHADLSFPQPTPEVDLNSERWGSDGEECSGEGGAVFDWEHI